MDRFDELARLYGEMMTAWPIGGSGGGETAPEHSQFLVIADRMFDYIIRNFEPDYADRTNLRYLIGTFFDRSDGGAINQRYNLDFTDADQMRAADNASVLVVALLQNSISIHKLPYDTTKMVAFTPAANMFRPLLLKPSDDQNHFAEEVADVQRRRQNYLDAHK